MPRVRKGASRTRKHKRVLKATRGQIGAASRRYRAAREAILRAGQYATIGRKLKKRDFRRLWITRISAACRQRGLTYSRFINALATHGIAINRKSLADIAVSDPAAFDKIAAVAAKPAVKPVEKPTVKPAAEKPVVKKAAPAKVKAEPAVKKPVAAKKTKKKTTAKKKTAVKKTATKKTVKKKTATKKAATARTSKKSTTQKKSK